MLKVKYFELNPSSAPGIDSATGTDVFILLCKGLEIVVISVLLSLAMCIVKI
jgi:hypothetical protein